VRDLLDREAERLQQALDDLAGREGDDELSMVHQHPADAARQRLEDGTY
jgi:hypothetical protein